MFHSVCPLRKYGVHCNSTCHCKSGQCDKVNGVCTTPGCLAGYNGTSCDQRMFKPKYILYLISNWRSYRNVQLGSPRLIFSRYLQTSIHIFDLEIDREIHLIMSIPVPPRHLANALSRANDNSLLAKNPELLNICSDLWSTINEPRWNSFNTPGANFKVYNILYYFCKDLENIFD